MPITIAILIICLYFLIGFLYAKKDKFDLKSFTSLGYATSFLVVMILFYAPLKDLINRTTKDATSIKIGDAEISLSLPIVAINHVKNEIVSSAIDSEKKIMKDTTNNPEVIRHLLRLTKFEMDRMKCEFNNIKVKNISSKEMVETIKSFEEFHSKMLNIILPLIIDKKFVDAMNEYENINNNWQNNVEQNVPQLQTIYGILCAANGDYKKSEKIFTKALERFPNDVSILHYCGGISMNNGDLIGAIHNTKRAMAILDREYDSFVEEYNNTGILISEMILSSKNREEIQYVVEQAKLLGSDNIPKPTDYERFITGALMYWKYRLAYLLALARLDESSAREFANDLRIYISDSDGRGYPDYLDVIGLVKLVFAKNTDDILESKRHFYAAKKIANVSKIGNINLMDRINSHIKLVEDVLKN